MLTTDLLWKEAQAIISQHMSHPFSQALSAGSLPLEVFKFYLQQDALYIIKYAQAMETIAQKAPNLEVKDLFMKLAQDSYELEHLFLADLFEYYHIEPTEVMQPACLAYTSYLLATVSTEGFISGLTSLLPCFWVYSENGKNIARKSFPKNPYQTWINTYVSAEFSEQTELVKNYVNIFSKNLSMDKIRHMSRLFSYSCRLDFQFMDDAYNLRRWQV